MALKISGAKGLGKSDLLTSSPQLPKPYDPARQAEGYRRRLEEGLGVDVDKGIDDRNIIGRTLNLRKNQNFILDVFEVINRPQQALFAGLEAAASGGNAFEAMKKGLSGEDYTRFADVLAAYGVEDSAGRKVAGFLGDVLLDPMNLPLIATGMPMAKGALTTKKAAAVAKSKQQAATVIAAANQKGSGIQNVIQTAEDINKVAKRGIEAKKTFRQALKGKATAKDLSIAEQHLKQYNSLNNIIQTSLQGQTYTQMVSPLRAIGGGIKKGFGATVQYTDSAVSGVLRKIDEANGIVFNNPDIKSIKDFAMMSPLPENIKASMLQNYYDIKNTVLATFDYARVIPDRVLKKISEATSKLDVTKNTLETKLKFLKADIDKTWEVLKTTTDESGNLLFKSKQELDTLLQRAIEYKYKYDPKILGQVSLDEVLHHGGHRLNQKAFDTLVEVAERSGISGLNAKTLGDAITKQVGADGNTTYLLSDDLRRKLLEGIGTNNTVVLNTLLDKASFYDQEMIKFLDTILANKDFLSLVEKTATELETFQKAVSALQKQAKLENMTEAGYIRHVYNRDFDKVLKSEVGVEEISRAFPGERLRTGNVQAVAERQFKMSAYEANRVMQDFISTRLQDVTLSDEASKLLQSVQGKDIFIESLTASATDWITEIPALVKDASIIDEVLIKMSVNMDPAGVGTINPVSDVMIINYTGTGSLPKGYVEYSHTNLIKQLEKLTKVVDSKEMLSVLDYLKSLPEGGRSAIDRNVFQMLSYLSDTSKTGPLIGFIEGTNNFFKKTKLLSPGFQMRNIIGNSTNMHLAGMPLGQIPIYTKRADGILKKAPEISQKVISGTPLTAAEQAAWSYFERFVNSGFLYTAEAIYDIPETVLKAYRTTGKMGPRELAETVIGLNNYANQFMDARFRMGLLMYADQTPKIMERLGVSTAEDVVRRALFDPKSISPLERQVVKRIIPFYTWAKKNLAWQVKNLMDNPERYNRLVNGINAAWDANDVDWRELERYKRENFWIPVPGLSDGNKYTAIRTNLPIRSLAEFSENPLKNIIGITAPLVRVPFELATGTQIFTQRPIQDFPGQRGYNFDFLTRRQEYLLSQTGLDVPARTIQGLLGLGRGLQDPNEMTLGGVIPSAFAEGSLDRARQARAYDELAQIRDLYSYYKQEAGQVPTIAEIENRNRNTMNLKQRMNRLKIR